MAVGAPAIQKGGSSLPAEVAAAVREDWSTAELVASQPGDPVVSVVTFVLGSDETSRSNQQYDVVEVARATVGSEVLAARKAEGHFIGGNSTVSDPVKAVKADAAKGIEAADAVPAMLTVQTRWKARK
jgi:hypothetical protein